MPACLPPAANEIYSDFKQGARLPPMVDFNIANSSKILMLFIFSFWKKVSSQIPLLSSHPCPLMVDPHIRYTKFCIGFKIRKSRCRTTLGLRFGLLKMVFECSIAWCDLRLGRAIVHCQRNHLRKPKFSRNRAILSDHFSGVKFSNGFFWIGFFWFCIGFF